MLDEWIFIYLDGMTGLDKYAIGLSHIHIFQPVESRTLDLSQAQGYKTSMLSQVQNAESRTILLIMGVSAYTAKPQQHIVDLLSKDLLYLNYMIIALFIYEKFVVYVKRSE